MTESIRQEDRDEGAPFGTRPKRDPGLLIVLGVAYGIWLVVLLWMAFLHSKG